MDDKIILYLILALGVLLLAWPLVKWLAGGWIKARLGLETHQQAFRKKSVVDLLTLKDNLERQGNKAAANTCKALIVSMVSGEAAEK